MFPKKQEKETPNIASLGIYSVQRHFTQNAKCKIYFHKDLMFLGHNISMAGMALFFYHVKHLIVFNSLTPTLTPWKN